MALLSIRKLHKQYGSVTAIQSLDLDLEKGEVIVLLGPSGCGKSTLLRCVNGLEPHQGGSIVMDGVGEFGKDVSWQTARQKVGMVFQSTAALDPEMVREVLEVVLELAREGMSMLIVTHEMGFARKVADCIVFMDKGGIVESSDPETFFSAPKSERARQFLAGMDY